MEAIPRKQVTFNDLDTYINQCISELDSCLLVYENQCNATNLLLAEITAKKDKLEKIHEKMNFLKFLQIITDQSIQQIGQNQNCIEGSVKKLENEASKNYNNIPKDVYREELGKITEEIDTSLQYYNKLAEENLTTAVKKFKSSLNDPFEAVGQILMTDLDMLEQIEFKSQKLINLLNLNERKQNELIQKSKLRKLKHKSILR